MAHHCHAPGCRAQVPPKMLMCRSHWRAVPAHLRAKVLREYVPGQEVRKDPTAAYLEVAREACDSVRHVKGEAVWAPCVSVLEPHASCLVYLGVKLHECRTWKITWKGAPVRGRLFIATSKEPSSRDALDRARGAGRLPGTGAPLGHVIGCVNVVDDRPMTRDDVATAFADWGERTRVWTVDGAWRLANPWPISGQLGLYGVNVNDGQSLAGVATADLGRALRFLVGRELEPDSERLKIARRDFGTHEGVAPWDAVECPADPLADHGVRVRSSGGRAGLVTWTPSRRADQPSQFGFGWAGEDPRPVGSFDEFAAAWPSIEESA